MSSAPGQDDLVLDLPGHLTLQALEAGLASLETSLAPRQQRQSGLLIDASRMTGYDSDARARFVEWNSAHRARIARVAIVTPRALWHMVIAAMSVASRQKMRAFDDAESALLWLRQD